MFRIYIDMLSQKRISGEHLFSLLEHIMLYGSISRAAVQTGVSYRYAWGLLQEAEKNLDLLLVEKQAGGYAGGGAVLTSEGKDMLEEYKLLKTNIDHSLELFLDKIGYMEAIKKEDKPVDHKLSNYLLIASTMEPVETGLMDELETFFYKERGVFIRHLAAGSGRALEFARAGRVDMALTHAPALEKEFMQEGWGVYQYPIMTNDFIIIGPASDPARIGQIKKNVSVKEIFKRIASSESPFVSRGDHSGTNLREIEIWEKSGITPKGNWYLLYPGVAGNLGAIRFARENNAYIFTDRASYCLSHTDGFFKIFLENDQNTYTKELSNVFVLTLVNPEKVASSRLDDAIKFARWLQREKGRKIIDTFGQKTYNRSLFTAVNIPQK